MGVTSQYPGHDTHTYIYTNYYVHLNIHIHRPPSEHYEGKYVDTKYYIVNTHVRYIDPSQSMFLLGQFPGSNDSLHIYYKLQKSLDHIKDSC